MNKSKMVRLERLSQKCEHNLTHLKDLIRWCKDYKAGKVGTVGAIMAIFTLKYDDVAFVIDNLEEIIIFDTETGKGKQMGNCPKCNTLLIKNRTQLLKDYCPKCKDTLVYVIDTETGKGKQKFFKDLIDDSKYT